MQVIKIQVKDDKSRIVCSYAAKLLADGSTVMYDAKTRHAYNPKTGEQVQLNNAEDMPHN